MSEEGICCPVCMERFNESRHSPLLLGCGHTFCRDCLCSLHKTKQQLKCPHCNKVDHRAPDLLPKNYILSEVVLKSLYNTTTESDPWSCKLHPGENIAFMSQSTRQLFCSECLNGKNVRDLIMLESQSMASQLKVFKDLYEGCSVHDLHLRAEVCGQLSEALEGQKLRVITTIDSAYMSAVQALENQFTAYKQRIATAFNKERDKLTDTKDLLNLLKEMKSGGVPMNKITQSMPVPKQLQIIGALMSISEIGISADLKKLAYTPFEFQNKIELPSKAFDVAVAIIETPVHLLKGIGASMDTAEKKLSRFGPPTNRWGIFEGRNQIEAVTFTVNKKMFITGVGIGNAYHVGKTVKIENLKVINGSTTNSPAIYEDTNIDLFYEANSSKVVKISFKKAVELECDHDYTIKAVLKGDAGVFRGGTTTRTKNGENGIIFKFKNTTYDADDVKNGENADDGPIFDIYYKLSIDQSSSDMKFSRFESAQGQWGFFSEHQVEAFTFSFDKPVMLSGFGVANPVQEGSTCTINSLKILKGNSTQGQLVFENPEKMTLTNNGADPITKIQLSSLVKLQAGEKYTVRIEIKGSDWVFRGQIFKGNVITVNKITLTTEKAEYAGGDTKDGDNERDGPLIDIYIASTDAVSAFGMGEVPDRLVELAGGETQICRFEETDKQWHLNSENQVETFSFSFSEDVLLTALGLGNCVKVGNFITVENVQILSGSCSIGPIIYNSTQQVCLYNHTDTNPVVKVKLESPLKITGNIPYTLRVIMRGEGKAYKGKKFRGAAITMPDGIIFKSMKSRLGGTDKRNGDNESAGPLFDVYYIPLEKPYSLDQYNELLNLLFPKFTEKKSPEVLPGEESKVCRYATTGSSWHINTDGKQVEAISFKVSKNIRLTALGLGNAHEESKKVTIRKIQIREGKSTRGNKVYNHSTKEKLINIGEESKFVRVGLENPVILEPETWYTLRIKYKQGAPVCRGTTVNNHPSANGVQFDFEKAKFDGGDMENGSHEVHGPLRDFYFHL
ncbi:unnamed protein product [Blepharisma stoltei]|uniref:RING-type domain-containing protein n=1 Tax=Blepharisma stoltei TaxID=1481888 RepID=A0AAU9JMV9_9CILI|nr:unnamed protein product [Blepharisma stoltei]